MFGEIRQLGYMVRDIEKAMDHWVNVMGVGPFFHIPRLVPDNFTHRGVSHQAPFAAAVANSGPLQIELVQPLDDTPSMWNEFLEDQGEGLQHVAYWTDDYDTVLAQALDSGLQVGHQGSLGGGRFVYFDTPSHAGTVIELSEYTGEKLALFSAVREAAAHWDGSDPIRVLHAPTAD
ncbi:VOC family protein [Streptomyces sp. NPDC001833]|uniref:VOC family protein n=1 Tax=Streptomyces sp. NPDC001833 TaxID=3154658 RepID=UPI003333F644